MSSHDVSYKMQFFLLLNHRQIGLSLFVPVAVLCLRLLDNEPLVLLLTNRVFTFVCSLDFAEVPDDKLFIDVDLENVVCL